jgi:Flp pilus assembly protein CpaB
VENIMSSKLFTTRQGTILLGVIAAVIAAVALLVYLNHYRNSVSTPPVSVLVANKLIQQGMSGKVIADSGGTKSSYYVVTKFPKSSVETGAILDPATLNDQVALHDIASGQQLTAADFGPSTANSLPNQLAPDQRAVVVSLGSPQEVGGQISNGSHVDVWVAFNGQAANGVARPVVRLLYQDMYVLNAGTNGGNVTLRAAPRQAGTLIYASQNAQIWLVLRPTVGTTVTKPPVVSSNSLVGLPPVRVGG